MSNVGFHMSIGTGMGAQDRQAMFTWNKGLRWRTLSPSDGLDERRLGQADVRMWKRPGDGKEFVVEVALPCPNCLFPLTFRPKPGEEFEILEGDVLHYRGVIACPAHWPELSGGVPTGRKIACNFQAMIIEGRCHQVNGQGGGVACPCVKPGASHTPTACRCGGYPSEDERVKLINR